MRAVFVFWLAMLGSATTMARDVDAMLNALLQQMPAQARATADAIPGLDRRLLATRAYIRAGDALAQRWSWSAEEAAAFASSGEGRELQRAVALVQCVFSARNPGYTLYVNPGFRSTAIQLQRWNTNASVGAAARRLLQMVERDLAGATDPKQGAADLKRYLAGHVPDPVPSLAAPGLSPHGQARAIDFQVMRNGRIIAGTSTATIGTEWDEAGWTTRLAQAVAQSGENLAGPLQSPREPWHYTYNGSTAPGERPASTAADSCRQPG